MEFALIIFKQTCTMLVLMLIGVVLYKKQLISKQGSKELGSLLLYLVLPTMIIKSFAIEFTKERAIMLGITCGLAVLVLGLSMLLSHWLLGANPIDDFAGAFSNAGFIGMPLVQSVLGESGVFYIAAMIALLGVLQWTYGVYLICKDKRVIQLKTVIRNPILISFVIGVIIFFLPFPLPTAVIDIMGSISNLNAPLAMMVLGVYLAQADLKMLFESFSLYKTCIVRLLIIPLITVGCIALLPVSKDAAMALIIAAAAPCGANVAIYAQQYNADYTRAVMLVCLSTLLSIVSLPLIIMLASAIL